MGINAIPPSRLEADASGTLRECVAGDQAFVVELPDHRLVSIPPLEPTEDEDLVDEQIPRNPAFRALVEKSKASLHKPLSA